MTKKFSVQTMLATNIDQSDYEKTVLDREKVDDVKQSHNYFRDWVETTCAQLGGSSEVEARIHTNGVMASFWPIGYRSKYVKQNDMLVWLETSNRVVRLTGKGKELFYLAQPGSSSQKNAEKDAEDDRIFDSDSNVSAEQLFTILTSPILWERTEEIVIDNLDSSPIKDGKIQQTIRKDDFLKTSKVTTEKQDRHKKDDPVLIPRRFKVFMYLIFILLVLFLSSSPT